MKNRPAKIFKNKTLKSSRFSKSGLIIFGLIFAFIGGYIIYRIFAAPLSKVWDSQTDFQAATLSNATANTNGTLTLAKVGDGISNPPACSGVAVNVSDNVQTIIDNNPTGTTFCIKAGVHRIAAELNPKDNDTFIGERGAIMSGAQDISSSFSASGGNWVASGITQTKDNINFPDPCQVSGTDVCTWLNDIYINDKPMTRVASLSALGSGKTFYDQATGKTYIADNPAGKKIEVGITPHLFHTLYSAVVNVTVEGLIVEKFASPVQTGGLSANQSWIIKDNDVRYNHGIGVQGGQIISDNHIHDNGQMGLAAYGDHTLVENNEIDHNDYAQVGCWEGGGTKFLWTTYLTVTGNYVHDHKYCPGLWDDTDNIYITYSNNVVEDNGGPGIFHEAGFDAYIYHNVVSRNGFQLTSWIDGSGILVNTSRNVEIYGNSVQDNRHGIGVTYTDRGVSSRGYGQTEVRNLYVHDNSIRESFAGGSPAGLASSGFVGAYTTYNNRFQNNYYQLCGGGPFYFVWGKPGDINNYGYLSQQQWIDAGQDTAGIFTTNCGPTPTAPPNGVYLTSGSATFNYDAGSTSDWTGITPTATVPSGTNITYQYQSSTDNNNWSNLVSDITQVPNGRYFRTVATLSTTDYTITPSIDKLTLNFTDGSSPPPTPGDVNHDGAVNGQDLSILLANWLTTNASCDFNTDGIVNIFDLSTLLSHFAS